MMYRSLNQINRAEWTPNQYAEFKKSITINQEGCECELQECVELTTTFSGGIGCRKITVSKTVHCESPFYLDDTPRWLIALLWTSVNYESQSSELLGWMSDKEKYKYLKRLYKGSNKTKVRDTRGALISMLYKKINPFCK